MKKAFRCCLGGAVDGRASHDEQTFQLKLYAARLGTLFMCIQQIDGMVGGECGSCVQ